MAILLVKIDTNNVPDSPSRWKAGEVVTAVEDGHTFGTAEVPAAGNFYHITVTDKTLAEVTSYLQQWSHDPVTTQVSAVDNRRLIQVISTMVSSSGKNAFTKVGVDDLIAGINADYETADAVYDSHNGTGFRFQVTVPLAGRDELTRRVDEAVYGMQYARRRWYITAAGMAFLAGNGGVVSGTAAAVSGYLRDGLLD